MILNLILNYENIFTDVIFIKTLLITIFNQTQIFNEKVQRFQVKTLKEFEIIVIYMFMFCNHLCTRTAVLYIWIYELVNQSGPSLYCTSSLDRTSRCIKVDAVRLNACVCSIQMSKYDFFEWNKFKTQSIFYAGVFIAQCLVS